MIECPLEQTTESHFWWSRGSDGLDDLGGSVAGRVALARINFNNANR